MSFGTFIGDSAKTSAKSDSTNHDEKEKDDDKKEGTPEKKESTAEKTSEKTSSSSWLGDIWNDTVDGIYDYFRGSKDDPSLPKTTITNDKGQPVDGQGNPIPDAQRVGDKGTVDKKDVAENLALKPVDTPVQGDPWDYNAWWDIAQQQKQEKPAEPSLAENVANWVSEKWDRWFGNGKAAEYASTDDRGNTHKTTMSENGVDHESSDGTKTHADGRGVVQETKEGDHRYVDKTTGAVGETLRNGTDVHRNPDGTLEIKRDGTEVRINPDGSIDQNINGRIVHIDKDFISQHINGWRVGQHRQGDHGTRRQERDAEKPTEDGKPSVTTVEDAEDHSQMIVINDGHGNTVKLRKNGERILSSTDNPDIEVIASNKDDAVRMRVHGKEYFLRRQEGSDNTDRWYVYGDKEGSGDPVGWIEGDGSVYSYDKNDPTKVGERIGQVQGLNNDGSISNGTATVTTNGEVQLQGDAANVEVTNNNNVRIKGPEGTTVISREGKDGETSCVTNTDNNGQSDATCTNPNDGSFVSKKNVTVDEDGKVVLNPDGQIEGGETVVKSNGVDENGNDKIQFGLGDVNQDGQEDLGNATIGPQGVISADDGMGNWWGQDGGFHTNSGDTFWSDGSVDFSDGTSIDASGNVSYKGKYVGSAGGYGVESEGAVAARVSAIIGIAASIGNSASIDPGKIGQLMALYAELGNVQGIALQSGNLGAFMQADLAKATVAGAISEQQASQARQEMAKYFTDHPLNNDQLAQLQNQMRGASPEAVKQFMANSNWLNEQPEQQHTR